MDLYADKTESSIPEVFFGDSIVLLFNNERKEVHVS